jgi:hypothetical protein
MRNFAIYIKYNLGILKAGQSFIEKPSIAKRPFYS